MPAHSFAYLYERFPSYVQTFVYREAVEMQRQQMHPLLVSIRRPDDPPEVAAALAAEVLYLPEIEALRTTLALPRRVRWTVPRERRERDVNRLYEALWLGPELRRRGIRHVHAHFAGLAARTAWWLRKVFGIRYSFTGHANDIFCATDFPVTDEQLVRDAKFIVTETDYAREWLGKKHPHAPRKIFRVFNGIDGDFPPPAPVGSVPRILSVGRAVEKKGFRHVIEACRLLRERGLAFECQIVGGGPLEPALRAQIESAQLGDVVKLLGPRSQAEVRGLLAASQLFVLACVPDAEGGSDNLPTAIMEAMMGGVPVVSTALAGIPEMIDHPLDGLLVPPADAPALADAIERLLRNAPLALTLAARAQATARENFSIENTTRVLKHLLVRRAGIRPPAAARQHDPSMPRSRWLW